MSKKTLEHLSSLMDGEISQETGMFLTRRMCADEELGRAWERYHLIRDCLRGSGGNWSVTRVSMRLDDLVPAEAGHAGAGALRPRQWMKSVSGLAIAASVAVVAVLLVASGPEQNPAEPAAKPFTSPNPIAVGPISQPVSLNGGNDRLNSYLLRHNQVAGSVGRQGFVSLVPIVAIVPAPEELQPVAEETVSDDSTRDGNTDPQP